MPGPKRGACGLLAALAAAALLSLAVPARGGEAYYLVMFGSQRIPNNPNHSHSFAAFVRATWTDGCMFPAGARVEHFMISWLPANLQVRVQALKPECGVNLPLHDTVRWALGDDQRVSLWGPYQIEPELYHRALRRKDELESGQILYKSNDVGYRSDYACNCIHAISTIAEGYRLRVASPGWGEVASYAILRRLMPWVIDCEQTHPWVVYALGLHCYPIIYRDTMGGGPRSGAFYGPFYRMFGGERDLAPSYGPR